MCVYVYVCVKRARWLEFAFEKNEKKKKNEISLYGPPLLVVLHSDEPIYLCVYYIIILYTNYGRHCYRASRRNVLG